MLIVSSSDVVGDVREGVIVQVEEPACEYSPRRVDARRVGKTVADPRHCVQLW